VLEKNQKYFRLDIGGRAEAVSVDRLKPHLGPSNVAPALPPKRGRPSNAGEAGVGGRGRPPEVAASSRSWGGSVAAGGQQEILQQAAEEIRQRNMLL
jgi:hypothetical protein